MQRVMQKYQLKVLLCDNNKSISKGVRLHSWGLLLLFTVLCFSGCQNVDKKSPYQIFHYNEDVSVTTLDPAFVKSQSEIWIVSQIYNGLIDLDAQLKAVPSLAQSWELSNGNTTYTFHLRRDAQFCFVDKAGNLSHRMLNAKDVKFSFDRIVNPSMASPGAWIFAGKIDVNLNKAFRVLNDSTFVLQLLKPAASMLSLLTTNFGYILPADFKGIDNSVISRHPAGTGPFFVRRWEEEIKLVMRKNPNYHEVDIRGQKLPYLDAVNVTFVKNKQTAFMQFVAGSYDFFNGLEGSFKDELLSSNAQLKPKYARNMSAIITPFLNTEYIGCYLGNLPMQINWLQDIHLRRALLLSVDRTKLVQFFRNGLGDAGWAGFVPPALNQSISADLFGAGQIAVAGQGTGVRHVTGVERVTGVRQVTGVEQVTGARQVTQARQVTGAGQPPRSGQTFEADWDAAVMEYNKSSYAKQSVKPQILLSTTADYLDMMLFLQETWQRLGVKVKVDIQTGGMLRQLRNEGKLSLFRGSWIADYPDAENFLACFYGPYLSPNGPNYTQFRDAEFDALYAEIEAGNLTSTQIDRRGKIARANDIIMNQAPVIPLYYDKSIRLIQPWVQGLTNDATNRLVLKNVKIKSWLSQKHPIQH